jgi:hydroxymethylglutaryl-CoA reductase
MSDSLFRGARAAAESGGFRTYVLADRITRASCFVCKSTADAIELARWIEAELPAMRDWLPQQDDPSISRFAKLREAKTHVVGPMCHVLWRWTTGDAVGANMMTRNAYFLNMGYVMERAPATPERALLESNMGGDKKPSYEYFQSGHGKTVIAETTLTEDAVRRVREHRSAHAEHLLEKVRMEMAVNAFNGQYHPGLLVVKRGKAYRRKVDAGIRLNDRVYGNLKSSPDLRAMQAAWALLDAPSLWRALSR